MPSMAAMNETQKVEKLANSPSSFWQAEAVRGVQITATLLIFLVGVPLNVLVVWALGQRQRRLIRRGSKEETRAASSFRTYVLNLALADLVLILRTPLMLGYLAHNNSWPFGLALCRLVMFLRGLGLYMSDPGLFVTETVAGFILPLLVFLGSNLAILLTIRQSVPVSPTVSSPSASRRMSRMYQVLFLTMLLFLICWVPYFVCRFLRALAEGRPDAAALYKSASYGTYISLYLVYTKSALNPVLYVFAARGLGRAVRASVTSTIERLFNDDSTESIRKRSLKNSQI
ncbi:C5a anaphylatoxin chemotactic receptor 1 [Hippocampus comes]|uniref:C5a anaphylatoxin chemotactic receptor 1 n=1 Tax=Hippocampus comes TaxID=109280 RepID=UPI00094F265A|nr:PREDICTED: C5a anaphylatoxin chemotactic receptor 1-like [Hippocampus comes]